MQTSKTLHYDVIIVGAGINGCTSAYFLSQAGLKVALVDKTGIASGGSGAAGAFISPKFSKQGSLKELIDVAYYEAMNFYPTVLPSQTLLKPLLHMSQDNQEESVFLEQSAVVEARSACETLA
ncbi:MAG TPA: FAD-dependent oxidoreductase, partial [Sulfuricurvum sp.]|nr:FAD-dependent oxidoreductase [Sulfuricurvum sp.]